MHLKRLDINGFKSFAGKTELEFGPGITAIVGPNGSGKSNLADAIRWALGEQSSRPLRLKKSEELVFAGTSARPRASLAEVSLLLDNADGGLALDFSEVQLTRLLYRSGESEYRLNGRKIKLAEIQQLLAAAGFGQNSYTVIGQGTMDSFILATPAERKLLFDEASGIHQFDLKRDQAIKQLEATEANLSQAKAVVAELGPRLETLQSSVAALKERQALESELDQRRRHFAATAIHHSQKITKELRAEIVELKQAETKLQTEVERLEAERRQLQTESKGPRPEQLKGLHRLEVARDQLTNKLSLKKAELQYLEDKTGELAELRAAANNSRRQLEQLAAEQGRLRQAIDGAKSDAAAVTSRLEAATRAVSLGQTKLIKLRRGSEEKGDYLNHALSLWRHLAGELGGGDLSESELVRLVHKVGRLLTHAVSISTQPEVAELRRVQTELTALMQRRDRIQEEHTGVVLRQRSLELDEAHLRESLARAKADLAAVESHLTSDSDSQKHLASRRTQLTKLEQQLANTDRELADGRARLAAPPVNTRVFQLARVLEQAKAKLGQQQRRRREAAAELKQAEADHQRHRAWGAKWGELDSASIKPSRIPVVELERELVVLESKLSASAQPDRELEQDYRESQERYDFLNRQITDLESAKSDLAKAVAQLDGLIKDHFQKAFTKISDRFGHYFTELFGGGSAGLELEVEAGDFGIEIKAVPPGKRVTSLAMLSGGERALTGIALLAAILAINPSPFVVMDEVDAALDEVNSARFGAILKSISRRSQLLVITHNRQTMAAASVLYGVTMDKANISTLLSLRLEQAKTMAQVQSAVKR